MLIKVDISDTVYVLEQFERIELQKNTDPTDECDSWWLVLVRPDGQNRGPILTRGNEAWCRQQLHEIVSAWGVSPNLLHVVPGSKRRSEANR